MAYQTYAKGMVGQGENLLAWEDLSAAQRFIWETVAAAVANLVLPRPSKDKRRVRRS